MDECKSGGDGGFDDDEDEVGDDLEVSALSQTISQSLKKFVEKFQHRNKEDKSESTSWICHFLIPFFILAILDSFVKTEGHLFGLYILSGFFFLGDLGK